MLELGGWDDESDDDDVREEDSDDQLSEEEEDDDDYWSESEVTEAVTPTSSSPGSPSGFILQPLFLTKPPGC